MIRRYGAVPENGQRYRWRTGVYAILPRNGQILLTWQDDPHFEFQLPGGGVDSDESLIQALHREVLEETGWRIGRARKLGVFRRFTHMPEYDQWAQKVCHIYMARPVVCLGPPSEPAHVPVWGSAADANRLLGNDGDASFLARAAGLRPRRSTQSR